MSAAYAGPADPTLAAAATAARAGRLDEAAAALHALDGAGASSAAALDLLAKVHAQRGEYAQADACWAKVQALEPGHPGAAAGRRAIAAGRRPRPGRWLLGALVAVLVLVGGVVGVVAVARGTAATAHTAAASAEPGAGGPAPTSTNPQAASSDDAAHRTADLDRLAGRLRQDGLRVRRGPADVEVDFETVLFRHDSTLTRDGRAALTRLAAVLGPAVGEWPSAASASADGTTPARRIMVVGHSVAVPGGPKTGGSSVALARAAAAASALATSGGPPLTAYTLATAEQGDEPWPDASRNRTVTVMLIAP